MYIKLLLARVDRALVLTFGLLLAFNWVQSQELKNNLYENELLKDSRVEKVIIDPEKGTPSMIKVNNLNPAVNSAKSLLASFLQLRAGTDELREFRIIPNKEDVDVIKMQQYYKGVKVEHGKYTTIKSNGSITAFTGEFYPIKSLDLVASISEQQALNSAKSFVGARVYAWEQFEELRKKETNPDKLKLIDKYLQDFLPKGELVIIQDFFVPGSQKLDLAYKFDIYAADPLSRGYVFVNAHTGKIMYYDKIIKHLSPDLKRVVEAPSITPEAAFISSMSNSEAARENRENKVTAGSVLTSLPTRYVGIRQAGTKQISGNDPNSGNTLTASNPSETYVPGSPTYVLIDDTRGGGFQTYDLNGVGGLPISFAPAYLGAKSFTDVNNIWTLARAYAPAQRAGQ